MKSPEIEKEEPLYTLDKTLELLRHLREDYSEKIPGPMICGMPDGKLLKVQKNWFQDVVDIVDMAKDHLEFRGGLIDSEITSFLEFYTSKEFHNQERVKREDINRANKVLELSRRFLEELKRKEEKI